MLYLCLLLCGIGRDRNDSNPSRRVPRCWGCPGSSIQNWMDHMYVYIYICRHLDVWGSGRFTTIFNIPL